MQLGRWRIYDNWLFMSRVIMNIIFFRDAYVYIYMYLFIHPDTHT